MIYLERAYSPGAVIPELWAEVEASRIQIVTWPNREVSLKIEFFDRGEPIAIRNPEPGMNIYVGDENGIARRVKISTAQAYGMYTAANLRLLVTTTPLHMVEQPKQEAQGISLTQGVAVAVPAATETKLGEFAAWRTGLLRVAGTISADPASIQFRLYSKYTTGGVILHQVANTGAIAHRPTTYEYSLRSGADTFLVPCVHAGRYYHLTVEHGSLAAKDFTADVYIEPVALN